LKNIFQRMKEQIVSTALSQFLEHGIRSMNMQRLASFMGISTKTLYKFFPDKEALLEACLLVHYEGMDKELAGKLNKEINPVELICMIYAQSTALDFGANHLFYHDLNHYYPELQDKVIGKFFGELGQVLTDKMEAGIREGYFLPWLQPEIAFRAINVLYTSVTRSDTFAEFKLNPDDLVKHTIDIYLRGICTEKGLAIINKIKNQPDQ